MKNDDEVRMYRAFNEAHALKSVDPERAAARLREAENLKRSLARKPKPKPRLVKSEPAAWIFAITEGVLPGQFFVQPFRPGPAEIPDSVLEQVYLAFQEACAAAETMSRWGIAGDAYSRMVDMSQRAIKRRLGNIVDVWVIPREELLQRARRGEFQVKELTQQEELQIDRKLGRVRRKAESALLRTGMVLDGGRRFLRQSR